MAMALPTLTQNDILTTVWPTGIWTSRIGIAERYCSGNWGNDNGNGGTEYGVDVEACQAECDSMASCYGIAITTDGTRQCVTCTGEDQTLTYNAVWNFYEKPAKCELTGSWNPEGYANNIENVEPRKEVTFPGFGTGIGVIDTDNTVKWIWADIGSAHTGTFSDDCNTITWENDARWNRVQSQVDEFEYIQSGTCESNGMKSIHDEAMCSNAAAYFEKSSTNVIIKENNHGDDRPTGCSWHRFGNLELWKSSSGDCEVNGYDGCFCLKSS